MVSEIKADPAVLDHLREPATSRATAHVYMSVCIFWSEESHNGVLAAHGCQLSKYTDFFPMPRIVSATTHHVFF